MPDQRTLILGGARSGKSIAAERRLASEPEVVYVATGGDDSGDAEWAERVAKHQVEERIADLADAWSRTPRLVVAVSNDIGSGVVPADPGTRLFRDLMGRLNTTISLASDQVLWTIAGRTLPLT